MYSTDYCLPLVLFLSRQNKLEHSVGHAVFDKERPRQSEWSFNARVPRQISNCISWSSSDAYQLFWKKWWSWFSPSTCRWGLKLEGNVGNSKTECLFVCSLFGYVESCTVSHLLLLVIIISISIGIITIVLCCFCMFQP